MKLTQLGNDPFEDAKRRCGRADLGEPKASGVKQLSVLVLHPFLTAS